MTLREAALDAVVRFAASEALAHERRGTTVVVELPGEHKLTTAVSVSVGEHSVAFNAFVMRRPDDNVDRIHEWLLKRNRRLFAVGYAIDHLGDVYLVSHLPLVMVDEATVDGIMGSILATADGDFDVLVAMGFESAIRHEWAWRLSRGEPTRNLEAFRHLAPDSPLHLAPERTRAAGFPHER